MYSADIVINMTTCEVSFFWHVVARSSEDAGVDDDVSGCADEYGCSTWLFVDR